MKPVPIYTCLITKITINCFQIGEKSFAFAITYIPTWLYVSCNLRFKTEDFNCNKSGLGSGDDGGDRSDSEILTIQQDLCTPVLNKNKLSINIY